MLELCKQLAWDRRGATAIEYGLIVALIFLAIAGAVTGFADSANAMWDYVGKSADDAINV